VREILEGIAIIALVVALALWWFGWPGKDD